MTETTVILVLLAAGLGTFALRYSFVYLHHRWTIPQGLRRMLRFVPAAVLAALVAPAVLLAPVDAVPEATLNPHLLAALVAALVMWRTRQMPLSLVSGMGVLWAVQGLG